MSVDDAHYTETVETLGKTILENPTKAVLTVANMLNQTVTAHLKKGGQITPLITYLRTRVEFTHNVALSNMPVHTLRNTHTLAQAEALNPSFKTLAALAHVLVSIKTANFPWGDDDNLAQSTKDMADHIADRGPRDKKPPTLAEQNLALIRGARGTKVQGGKLPKGA